MQPNLRGVDLTQPASIIARAADRYALDGALTYATVSTFWISTKNLFRSTGSYFVDLSAVTEIDSAGLALLIDWVRRCRASGATITFEQAPTKLTALAKIGDLSELLNLS